MVEVRPPEGRAREEGDGRGLGNVRPQETEGGGEISLED